MKNSGKREQTQNLFCSLPNERILCKRTLFMICIMLCFAFSSKVYAQRALPGMRSVELKSGMADRMFSKNKSGYYFGAAMATYTENANKWVFGVEYLNRRYPYKDIHIPVAQFTGEGGYYKKLMADGTKTFFLSLGASAMAGYETVNWGDKLLFDGARIEHKDRFLYGTALSLELETYLTDGFILSLAVRERILWGTTTGRFHTQLGISLKYIIN